MCKDLLDSDQGDFRCRGAVDLSSFLFNLDCIQAQGSDFESTWDNLSYCGMVRTLIQCHLNLTSIAWWRHQMETFSALLTLCVGNPLVPGESTSQRPVMWSFNVFFDLCLNKQLRKQLRCWLFEMPLYSLWSHCNGNSYSYKTVLFPQWNFPY